MPSLFALLTCLVFRRYFFSSRGPRWSSLEGCATLTPECCRLTSCEQKRCSRQASPYRAPRAPAQPLHQRRLLRIDQVHRLPRPLGGPFPASATWAHRAHLFPHAERSFIITLGARPDLVPVQGALLSTWVSDSRPGSNAHCSLARPLPPLEIQKPRGQRGP